MGMGATFGWQADVRGLCEFAFKVLTDFGKLFPLSTPYALMLEGVFFAHEDPARSRKLLLKAIADAQSKGLAYHAAIAQYELAALDPDKEGDRFKVARETFQAQKAGYYLRICDETRNDETRQSLTTPTLVLPRVKKNSKKKSDRLSDRQSNSNDPDDEPLSSGSVATTPHADGDDPEESCASATTSRIAPSPPHVNTTPSAQRTSFVNTKHFEPPFDNLDMLHAASAAAADEP
jgi:hypothetical protein